jgi:hypothetical protein
MTTDLTAQEMCDAQERLSKLEREIECLRVAVRRLEAVRVAHVAEIYRLKRGE